MFYSVFVGCFYCVLLLVEVSCSGAMDEGVSNLTLQELLRKINEQDHKIATLEAMAKKDRKEFTTKISTLEAKIRRSDSRQSKLEKKIISILKLETLAENVDTNSELKEEYRKTSTEKNKQSAIILSLKKNGDNSNSSDARGSRKERRILSGTVPSTHVVAFYAYMSKSEPHPGQHQTIIFETVITNVGSSYNQHSGIFTAPTNGVYVFSWNVYSQFNGHILSELMVNSVSIGGRLSDSRSVSEDQSSSGTVVVEISQGDIVYVRTHPTATVTGSIISNSDEYQSSFSGWLLG